MMWKTLKFSREKQQISSEEEEEEEEERREEMQLYAALATRATTRTTTTSERREGEFFSSSNTSKSLFFVRRRNIRRSEREAKTKTTTTPRVGAFLFNNDGENNKKRTTSRRTSSSPKPKLLQQGDLTKKRCDACLGTGKIPCYNCTRRTSGWESGGNAVGGGGGVKAISVADTVGYVPAKRKTQSLFSLPFGWKTTSDKSGDSNKKKEEEEPLVRCPVCETCVPGKLVCGRCNGQGSLLYRSADWR